ncbi:MAG: hypothetical protein FWF29_10220, partial [Treponema sp.]|nr:hypothetical protein [Treponema sp.]
MRAVYRIYFLCFFSAVCLLTACDIPVALGSLVNTDVPVIKNAPGGNQPGSYLFGSTNLINLDVQQKFGIDSVFMTIWYTDMLEKEQKTVNPAFYDIHTGLWVVNIDTTGMADGAIRARVTAIDKDGKSTTTTDLVYTVKNSPPQIELTLPRLRGSAFDTITANHPGLIAGTIFQGNDIMGIASDTFSLAFGYPQIMLWPVRDPDSGNYPEGVSPLDFDINGFPRPGTQWSQWRTMLDDRGYALDDARYSNIGLKVTQFRWPLIDAYGNELATGFYGFKVRVKDGFDTVNTYPNRLDNEAGPGGTSLPEGSPDLNQFMQIQIIATDNPVIRWSGPLPEYNYEGFPNFYNGAGNFEVYFTIISGNQISKTGTKARLSNNESVNWGAVDYKYIDHVSGNIFRVNVIPEDIPAMLGMTNISGDKMLHIETVDNLGNIANASRPIAIDVTPPEMMFMEPVGLGESMTAATPPRVTSTVRFRGSALDNQRVVRMYYALGRTETTNPALGAALNNDTGWTDTLLHTTAPRIGHPRYGDSFNDLTRIEWTGTLSSWSWRFSNIADVCSTPRAQDYYATELKDEFGRGHGLWELPVKFKIVDVAGNVSIYEAKVTVDMDADLPLVFISSHTGGQTVGGQVRISGTAEDNELIYDVYMRVYRQSDALSGTESQPAELVQDWTPVNTPANKSSAISWHAAINGNKELDPPGGRGTRRVRVEFRALDAFPTTPDVPKDRFGSVTSLLLDFDNSVPVIDQAVILRGRPRDFTNQANLDRVADQIIAGWQNNQAPRPEGTVFDSVNGTIVSGFVTQRVKARDESGLVSIR